MANKTLNTRLVHKHDVEANWLKAVNFVPIKAEIIVYDIDDNYSYERVKVGDGTTLVSDLPFLNRTDATLLLTDIPADAKAVGDALAALPDSEDLRPLTDEEIDAIFADAGLLLPAAEGVAF